MQSVGHVLELASSFPPVPVATEATRREALALRPPSHVWLGLGVLHQALCFLAVTELYTRSPLTPALTSGALAKYVLIFLTLTLKTGVPAVTLGHCHSRMNCSQHAADALKMAGLPSSFPKWMLHSVGCTQLAQG